MAEQQREALKRTDHAPEKVGGARLARAVGFWDITGSDLA